MCSLPLAPCVRALRQLESLHSVGGAVAGANLKEEEVGSCGVFGVFRVALLL